MPSFDAEILCAFVRDLFVAAGTTPENAEIVARSLTLANLKGHDSHGVIRVLEYLPWIERGWIVPNAPLEIIRETDSMILIDGNFGFGQVIGRQATDLGIAKAKRSGVCALSIRRSGHLGRMGEWAERAAEAGLVYFSFTNTHGGGVLVAPHGGRERRLSANPLGAAAPVPDGEALVMDFATSTIAEGKIKVARAKGEALPPNCIINGRGEPSTSPEEYYADPPGALLPFGGHKGYGLSLFADIFAGALSGGGCSKKGVERIANAMLAIFLDPVAFGGQAFFANEVGNLVRYVKECPPIQESEGVMVPGEPEAKTAEDRAKRGIPIAVATWEQITTLARAREVAVPSPFAI